VELAEICGWLIWGTTAAAAVAAGYSAYLWRKAALVEVVPDRSKGPPPGFFKVQGVDLGATHADLAALVEQTRISNRMNARAANATAVAAALGFLSFVLQSAMAA